ncbi:alpha/beta hydrolase, partial [Pseudonocardia benzenivorans]
MSTPIRLAYGSDPSQFGELSLPPDGVDVRGTVVVVHGGFWRARYDLALGRPLATTLASSGFAAWNVEYRRVGLGGGWPATFEDLAAAVDLLGDL